MALDNVANLEPDAQFGAAVRLKRAQLGITLDQLALASGVTSGALSRVERGLLNVSLRNASAIARGLGCELGELLQTSSVAHVTRAADHARFLHEDSGVERVALAHPSPGLDLLSYRLPAGAQSSHFAPHPPGTREVFHVLKGSIRIWTAGDSVLLHDGDTAVLAMDAEHRFANEGDSTATLILLVVSPGHR